MSTLRAACGRLLVLALLGMPSLPALAQSNGFFDDVFKDWKKGRFYLSTSIYTEHFNPQPDHVNQQNLINIEYQLPSDWLVGAAFFDNSFGQESQYVFVGKQWWPFDKAPYVFVKVTGGILHGYKEPYEDKVPLNHNGYSPAIIPSIGVASKHFAAELVLFGTAGAMITVGVRFP